MLNRERVKLADQHRGIKDMRRVPDVLIVVDANFESTAIQEALRLEIPVIAIVDSNTDPSLVSHVIPANDDSIRTIQLILSALTNTILSAQVKDIDKQNDKVKDSESPKKYDHPVLKKSVNFEKDVSLDDKEENVKDSSDGSDKTNDIVGSD
jgi:small subunit ribosomal protein S2